MSKLELIAEVLTDSGKSYQKVVASGITYSAWETGPDRKPNQAYKQIVSKEFKVGDEVKLNYTENGKYKNLTSIEKIASGTGTVPSTKTTDFSGKPETKSSTDTDKMWELKDRRIARMNCVTNAVALAEIHNRDIKNPVEHFSEKNIIKSAKVFEKYIYEEDSK